MKVTQERANNIIFGKIKPNNKIEDNKDQINIDKSNE